MNVSPLFFLSFDHSLLLFACLLVLFLLLLLFVCFLSAFCFVLPFVLPFILPFILFDFFVDLLSVHVLFCLFLSGLYADSRPTPPRDPDLGSHRHKYRSYRISCSGRVSCIFLLSCVGSSRQYVMTRGAVRSVCGLTGWQSAG